MPSGATSEPTETPDPHRGWKRFLAVGHVVAGLVLLLGWLVLVTFWAVYVLGDNCFDGPCTFSSTQKTVAVLQAVIAAPGLVALGFAIAQGLRYAFSFQASTFTKQSLQTGGAILAAWIAFLLLALIF